MTSSSTSVGIVTDPIYLEHKTEKGHPECPDRLTAIHKALKPLQLPSIQAREATWSEIRTCHTDSYTQTVEDDIKQSKHQLSTGDTDLSSKSLQAASTAAGGVIAAVDAVIKGTAKSVFCLVRPPGHHAESNAGMGFCIFNNAAIAARHAQRHKNIDKVAIIDWDVHHGNGTQEIFYDDPTVFYFSTHQSNFYPGTGKSDETGIGPGIGATLNCPIEKGKHSRTEVISSFRDKLIPAIDKFKPDFVIISAGFDAHKDDTIGMFNLTDDDFTVLTKIVKEIARKYAGGKIVSILEGGYNLDALASAAKAHVIALQG